MLSLSCFESVPCIHDSRIIPKWEQSVRLHFCFVSILRFSHSFFNFLDPLVGRYAFFFLKLQLIYSIYQFQVYNILFQTLIQSYYKILTIFPVLYIISLWLIYFIAISLHLLIPFTDFLPLPHSFFPLETTSLFSVSLFLFYYICSFLCF